LLHNEKRLFENIPENGKSPSQGATGFLFFNLFTYFKKDMAVSLTTL
jgi:hypothetical protein